MKYYVFNDGVNDLNPGKSMAYSAGQLLAKRQPNIPVVDLTKYSLAYGFRSPISINQFESGYQSFASHLGRSDFEIDEVSRGDGYD